MNGFDPIHHGPAVWKLQGLKFGIGELAIAKVFKGWDAEKLAKTLGLNVVDVQRILTPPVTSALVSSPRSLGRHTHHPNVSDKTM
ncbi:hypothetical protein E7T06_18875 [Deinococcus sp. Arct2-2]|uniref:hypothetical protein n=1 Tax=Deinococcus sp. Arct2-2 TaxID=2568653 RepID=UPI0010A3F134|nr:hypothetical protein [Deinococcus sp. Arct2-2]THF67939.1 hypothetical protein E7T06_18875 [Deinococcus sp. Arct2-2]